MAHDPASLMRMAVPSRHGDRDTSFGLPMDEPRGSNPPQQASRGNVETPGYALTGSSPAL